ncbi:MAG: hypothetical protein ACJAWV_004435 [Flammeovirgaceae bacterium]
MVLTDWQENKITKINLNRRKTMKLPDSRTLFLVDSLGALLSAIAYGFVLTEFETVFGIPKSIFITFACLAFASFFWGNKFGLAVST